MAYEVKEISGKGLGVFATAKIARGTVILRETPMLTLPFEMSCAIQEENNLQMAKQILDERSLKSVAGSLSDFFCHGWSGSGDDAGGNKGKGRGSKVEETASQDSSKLSKNQKKKLREQQNKQQASLAEETSTTSTPSGTKDMENNSFSTPAQPLKNRKIKLNEQQERMLQIAKFFALSDCAKEVGLLDETTTSTSGGNKKITLKQQRDESVKPLLDRIFSTGGAPRFQERVAAGEAEGKMKTVGSEDSWVKVSHDEDVLQSGVPSSSSASAIEGLLETKEMNTNDVKNMIKAKETGAEMLKSRQKTEKMQDESFLSEDAVLALQGLQELLFPGSSTGTVDVGTNSTPATVTPGLKILSQDYALLASLKFWMNAVPGGPAASDIDEEDMCICTSVARFNHSCRPNAIYTWHHKPYRQVAVVAVADIEPEDEICISYLTAELMEDTCVARNQWTEQTLGFQCACEVCVLPTSTSTASTTGRGGYTPCKKAFQRSDLHFNLVFLPEAETMRTTIRTTYMDMPDLSPKSPASVKNGVRDALRGLEELYAKNRFLLPHNLKLLGFEGYCLSVRAGLGAETVKHFAKLRYEAALAQLGDQDEETKQLKIYMEKPATKMQEWQLHKTLLEKIRAKKENDWNQEVAQKRKQIKR